MSAKAESRLRKPRTRGAFLAKEAARRQLALLSVADAQGQARIYWLVDPATMIIMDARFIAFGSLASHALCDAFTELARGRTVSDACRLGLDQIGSLLRDDPTTPFCPHDEMVGSFLRELQDLAEAAVLHLTILPKPAETMIYQRKREADWTPQDRAWFSRSYLKKISAIDQAAGEALRQRLGPGIEQRTEVLHDDFRVRFSFSGLQSEQIATAEQFIQDALVVIHPQLIVEAADQKTDHEVGTGQDGGP